MAGHSCRELTTLWVARLNDGMELKVTDPKEQQGDVEEEETEGKKRRDCRELTTLRVARLDEGTELKVTDPKEQQGDVEEEEAKD